jgi:hypothetical protein
MLTGSCLCENVAYEVDADPGLEGRPPQAQCGEVIAKLRTGLNALHRNSKLARRVTPITYISVRPGHSLSPELHSAATGTGVTDMNTSRIALFAFAAIIGSGSLVSSAQQVAAGNLDFLNRMNPQYKNCVATTRANIAPQYRDTRAVHDGIIDNCARRYPPFGK